MSEPLTIALAQFEVTERFEENLARGTLLVEQAAMKGAKLVGFTELAFRPFFPQRHWSPEFFDWAEPFDGPTVQHFLAVAKRTGVDCVVNFYERADHGRFYDTTAVCRPNGEVLGPVRMAHAAEEPGYNEKFYYWSGDTPPQVFDLGYLRLGVAICYDRHFPEYTRRLVLAGAELILSPFAGLENDPLDLYEIEMQGLAFQNQVFVACVNRVGRDMEARFAGGSFVVGPGGDVLARASRTGPELLFCDLDISDIERYRVRRPFLRDRRPEFYRSFS